jgi:hypothetical protein
MPTLAGLEFRRTFSYLAIHLTTYSRGLFALLGIVITYCARLCPQNKGKEVHTMASLIVRFTSILYAGESSVPLGNSNLFSTSERTSRGVKELSIPSQFMITYTTLAVFVDDVPEQVTFFSFQDDRRYNAGYLRLIRLSRQSLTFCTRHCNEHRGQ